MEHPGDHQKEPGIGTTLAPRARRLLARVHDLCEAALHPMLTQILDEFDEQMFRFADQANNNTEQEICLASQREVRRGRADFAPRFLSRLRSGFERFHLDDAQPNHDPRAGLGLSLVDVDDQEEESILGTAEARVEIRSGIPLLELGYRFAALVGMPVIESDALPVGPRAICAAWQYASNELDLPPAHRQHLHKLFSRHLLREAPRLFEALNTLMAAQGLLPDLSALLARRMHGAQNKSDKTAKPDDTIRDEDSAPNAAAPQAAPDHHGRNEKTESTIAFTVLRNLLAQRRNALGLNAESTPPSGPASTPEQLQDALARLQQQSDTTVLENGARHVRSMKHLRQDLQAQLRALSPDGQPLAFDADQTDTIDLMTMLFDHLGRDMPIDGHAATLMTRMQVPMLRVALSDPEFFSKQDHPARQLLGSVLDTATQWLDGAGESADPVLARKLQDVVERTAEEFDGDVQLLDDLRKDLDSQLSVLRRRAEISERRHLEAAQGRERLLLARNRASELVAERLQSSNASGLLRTMMEQAWTDVLALSMLRWGERSKAFRQRLEVTDKLLRQRTEQDDSELREEITEGLSQVGIHGEEAEQIARHVVTKPSAGEPAPELTRTELAMRLKQRQRLGSGETEKPESEPAQDQRDPAAQEALATLRQQQYGAWLEFIRPDQSVLRRKLAWFSPVTGHCLVVNQRGVREDVGNLSELAAMMAAGKVRIPTERNESLLDRAWSVIVKGLRQFARNTAEQSA
ncbi:DUF1631 domain-containing protein [Oleiagrimonas citrea]|uniref:DUF1631 domain-containing protein n=1 Tax=Oleiagrimonas citrea TaxID=1665687 RepID=A0A846ZPK3_9GAMM|nr:DUF1631 family protein [Oleiagrimonas citrea]NKZ39381.1 DUF1631 domain-containing protein [Oleiagrimonas citrea]